MREAEAELLNSIGQRRGVGLNQFVGIVLGILAIGWCSTAAAAADIVILVNKVSQKMTVTIDGEKLFVWPVSTGAPGYDTPSGVYHPFRMEVDHFSKEWDDAPMPHSIFFTAEGHAIHGSFHTKSLGKRASHGCVRVSPENADKLYAMVRKVGMSNTTVVIKGGLFDGGVGQPDKGSNKRRFFFWNNY